METSFCFYSQFYRNVVYFLIEIIFPLELLLTVVCYSVL